MTKVKSESIGKLTTKDKEEFKNKLRAIIHSKSNGFEKSEQKIISLLRKFESKALTNVLRERYTLFDIEEAREQGKKDQALYYETLLKDLEEKTRVISNLKHRELPIFCLFLRREDDFCEKFSEYIVEVERFYRDDPKHKWNYYNGFCRYHLKEGLKRLKKGSNKIGVNIVHVWRFRELSKDE